MILRVPSYYKEFHCTAGQCKDSCCIGWEIDIDEDTYFYYKNVEGAFGEWLRTHMVTEETNSFALRENGWCPFLNEKKLCEICIALGEEALCEVCTEFPRFTVEYENVREKVLSLSCEEVGRLLFSSDAKTAWEEHKIPGESEPWEADGKTAELLEEVRGTAVTILQDRTKPVFGRAAEYLAYCDRMQRQLYGGEAIFSAGSGKCIDGQECIGVRGKESQPGCDLDDKGKDGSQKVGSRQAYQDFLARMESFERLEVLDGTWMKVKEALRETFSEENYLRYRREFLESVKDREYEYEHLLVYFTYRYFMRAYYDDNLRTKAQFAVAGVLMIRDMDVLRYVQNGGSFALCDRIDTAKIYSREVEHSEENMELLAEDFQFEDVFRVERLLGQI